MISLARDFNLYVRVLEAQQCQPIMFLMADDLNKKTIMQGTMDEIEYYLNRLWELKAFK